ncbi:hypothetical protein FHS55_003035 [Angulomicrobium tetraedrale]|uniref:Uncharacterized protein n=1 Tax=Ancylobacter tetraedralis TaxID=217068 RepID=A0A839ZCC1_9HYPH|nr:hypothetical protein [Ancylobacter tetraedralis]MBB3772423.1 hypothetical protein [Ancylobacter tetraedralis]
MLLRFSSRDELAEFVRQVTREAPAIASRIRSSYSQPTVATVTLDDFRDEQRLRSMAAGSSVKIFDDVTLKVMGAS